MWQQLTHGFGNHVVTVGIGDVIVVRLLEEKIYGALYNILICDVIASNKGESSQDIQSFPAIIGNVECRTHSKSVSVGLLYTEFRFIH